MKMGLSIPKGLQIMAESSKIVSMIDR
jgi:hypothetical protein